MRLLNIAILLLSLIFFTACSQKEIIIEDVQKYPQEPSYYLKNFQDVTLNETELSSKFIKKYFSPWSLESLKYSKKRHLGGISTQKEKSI